MKRVAFAVPGDLGAPTGGYAYDRRMIAELQRLGWQVDVIGLGDGFPRPSAEVKAAARESWPACRTSVRSLSTAWPSAFCRKRRMSWASGTRCWRWCIIRWRWKRVCRLPRQKPSRPASARRLRRRAESWSPAPRPRRFLRTTTTCPRTSSPWHVRVPNAARLRKEATTASCGCLLWVPSCRAKVMTC